MRRGRCELTFNASAFGLMAAITCFSTGATTQNEPTGQALSRFGPIHSSSKRSWKYREQGRFATKDA